MKRHKGLRLFVLGWSVVLLACTAGNAVAATATRYAAPAGNPEPSDCTDINDPCTLPVALEAAKAGDVLSLAAGTYNVGRMGLTPVPLHWQPTDPRTRPVITSPLAIPTLDLTAAQSGSSFDGLEIDNTDATPANATPALRIEAGVAASVRSTVVRARLCIDAPMSGPLTVDGSDLATTANTWCLNLGALSTVRHSTSVARRVKATGAQAVFGEGLVVDSVAQSFGRDQGAITADAPGGGTLRVVNSTAISTNGPALLARADNAEAAPVFPNDLVVTNSIARGKAADVEAHTTIEQDTGAPCSADKVCGVGVVHIDHSDFATRTPLASAPDGVAISEGPGNISGDPRFANAAKGDYHLLAGSPAIDAGAASDAALPVDLDGAARVQGAATDLGAFEATPPPAPPVSNPTAAGPASAGAGASQDRTPPVLGPARLSATRFRVSTRVTTTVSESGSISFAVQQSEPGRRHGGTCVAQTRALRHAAPCTRWITRGAPLARSVATAGKVALTFTGRLGARRLAPGRYRFAISAVDAAGNRSATAFAAFTIARREP